MYKLTFYAQIIGPVSAYRPLGLIGGLGCTKALRSSPLMMLYLALRLNHLAFHQYVSIRRYYRFTWCRLSQLNRCYGLQLDILLLFIIIKRRR